MPRYATRRVSARYSKTKQTRKGKRSTGRKYRRPTRPARRMSKKAILNITSRKKRDNMISYNNLAAGTASSTYATGAATLVGGKTYMLAWIPTARPMTTSGGLGYTVNDPAGRTATRCYMRGLKERIQIQTNSGESWQWRRIIIYMKGNSFTSKDSGIFKWWHETSNGVVRTINDAFQEATVGSVLNTLLWQGKQSTDWSSYFTAKVDNNSLTVVYDKTRILQSGNDSGIMRNFNMWHPINKNIVYADDEQGDLIGQTPYSVVGRAGMGDMYVFDIFAAATGAVNSDTLTFDPEATLYWHEK